MESALYEYAKTKKANPAWSEAQVASHVAKQINVYFGNLGRQGILKSASAQDLARLTLLAPQWVEAMLQKEARGVKQAAQAPFESIRDRQVKVGTIAKGLGTGLFAFFVATQLVNKYTTGHFTFDNKDEEHKLDAFIPDPTGKSAGWWVSPFSVVAHNTHDIMKYAEKGKNPIQIGGQVLQNKLSPLARAGKTLAFQTDWSGTKLLGADRVAKETAKSLLPLPLPLSSALSERKGDVGRQILSLGGIKADVAKDNEKQINDRSMELFKKQYSDLNVQQRAVVKRGMEQGDKTIQERYAMAQKATDKDFALIDRVNREIAPSVKKELDKEALSLGGYKNSFTHARTPITLASQAERDDLHTLMMKELNTRLSNVFSSSNWQGADKQKKERILEKVQEIAHKAAWGKMVQRLNSPTARKVNEQGESYIQQ